MSCLASPPSETSAFHGGFLSRPLYIFTGGFFGAGKTSLLAALGARVRGCGPAAGFITSDEGVELADTAWLRGLGEAVAEVKGGSLASRLDSLREAARRLEPAGHIFIELPGTALDVPEQVIGPFRQTLGREGGGIAPYTVVVQSTLAEQVLGLARRNPSPHALAALIRRQWAEADLLVVTAADRLDGAQWEKLQAALGAEVPTAKVLAVSSRNGRGLPEWLELLQAGSASSREAIPSSADLRDEALSHLGWLDSTIELTPTRPVEAGPLLESLLRHLASEMTSLALARAKAVLRAGDTPGFGLLQVVGGEGETACTLESPLEFGELTVNLRATTNPEKLHTALRAAVVGLGRDFPILQTEFAHLHYYQAR